MIPDADTAASNPFITARSSLGSPRDHSTTRKQAYDALTHHASLFIIRAAPPGRPSAMQVSHPPHPRSSPHIPASSKHPPPTSPLSARQRSVSIIGGAVGGSIDHIIILRVVSLINRNMHNIYQQVIKDTVGHLSVVSGGGGLNNDVNA
ncbi:hypothetical protein FRB96_004471 [Tulasnella sp. 330]|nr:hypothetical protein FRB96_004471 [Tulasnella sp. 330]KAG8867053.1 hypothetical protein FRB97_003566 [Tulasnella sp. 331]